MQAGERSKVPSVIRELLPASGGFHGIAIQRFNVAIAIRYSRCFSNAGFR
jgi:hypothetical protein